MCYLLFPRKIYSQNSVLFSKNLQLTEHLQALKLIKTRVKILFSIISSQISLDSSLDLSPDNLFHD